MVVSPGRHPGRLLTGFVLLLVGLVLILLAPLILLTALVGGLWRKLKGRRLRRQFEAKWASEGKELVFVYSNSPHWRGRIETEILPRIQDRAVVLNWSARSTEGWKRHPLEVRIIRFWGADQEFNPMAIVFPPRRDTQTIRFWQAYRDFRHGKPASLRQREAELFDAVGVPSQERPEVPVVSL